MNQRLLERLREEKEMQLKGWSVSSDSGQARFQFKPDRRQPPVRGSDPVHL